MDLHVAEEWESEKNVSEFFADSSFSGNDSALASTGWETLSSAIGSLDDEISDCGDGGDGGDGGYGGRQVCSCPCSCGENYNTSISNNEVGPTSILENLGSLCTC